MRLSGEMGVKSEWTRRIYEKKLVENMKFALKAQSLKPAAIVRARGRIYVKTPAATETAHALTRVFGISSLSPATQTTSELADVTQTALETAEAAIAENATFAVRCHRVGTHTYSSPEVCRMLGEQILEHFVQRNLKVNLTDPDVTLTVEIRDKEAYIYAETYPAQGGFPLGTQAKTVCLLSGGMDSPVACWLTMKRGSPQVPVYIDNAPYTDEATRQKALETGKKLKEWSTGHMNRIYVVPNGENIRLIQQNTPARFTCLLCKRLMYRIAEHVADKEKAFGIVTGEAIGEQASQTMHNLCAIDEAATRYPIHRPLLGFDKLETEAIARKIGTYQASTAKTQGCSAAPSMPATQAKLAAVKEAEAKLDVAAMAEAAFAKAEVLAL
ncbi:MAG: tRNA 4-thiouridine(8) synthase ThiI [Candidatus Bathyarchaeota archaeon]|nr:tRNA 4-thiouridine(8) synthase ThiI [Candidatus Bathyarchaeota archaeon]